MKCALLLQVRRGLGSRTAPVLGAVLVGFFLCLCYLEKASAALFKPHQSVPLSQGTSPGYLAVDDLNTDAMSDLVVSGGNGTLSLISAEGCEFCFVGSQELIQGSGSPLGEVVTSDLNQDGYRDIAVADPSGSTVKVLHGDAGGSFGSPIGVDFGSTGTNPTGLAVGELGSPSSILPEDSGPDLAVAEFSGSTVKIFFGDSTDVDGFSHENTFYLPSEISSALLRGVRLGDLNEDGLTDIAAVVSTFSEGKLVVWFANDTQGNFADPVSFSFGSAAKQLELVDLNNDQTLDAVATSTSGGTIFVLLGQAGGFAPVKELAMGLNPADGFATADFNGDKSLDLVVSSAAQNTLSVRLATDRSGNFGQEKTFVLGSGHAPTRLIANDTDSDGRVDLVTANPSIDTIGIVANRSLRNLVKPELTGEIKVGSTLVVDRGTWLGDGDISYTYLWQRCDSTGNSCADIGSTSEPTYTVTADDIGTVLRVAVVAKDVDSVVTANSSYTEKILANQPPQIIDQPLKISPFKPTLPSFYSVTSRVVSQTVKLNSRGYLGLTLVCGSYAKSHCKMEIRLKRAGRTVASTTRIVAVGATAKVSLKLSRKLRRTLKSKRRLRASVVVQATDATGISKAVVNPVLIQAK